MVVNLQDKEKVKTVLIIENAQYSRVCGYYSAVSNFNKGKKQEFEDRKFIKISDIKRDKNDR